MRENAVSVHAQLGLKLNDLFRVCVEVLLKAISQVVTLLLRLEPGAVVVDPIAELGAQHLLAQLVNRVPGPDIGAEVLPCFGGGLAPVNVHAHDYLPVTPMRRSSLTAIISPTSLMVAAMSMAPSNCVAPKLSPHCSESAHACFMSWSSSSVDLSSSAIGPSKDSVLALLAEAGDGVLLGGQRVPALGRRASAADGLGAGAGGVRATRWRFLSRRTGSSYG